MAIEKASVHSRHWFLWSKDGKKNLDQKRSGAEVLMNLSKAFDTLNHDLLLAKMHAYGFDRDSLKVYHSYLRNRYQRTKNNKRFSL